MENQAVSGTKKPLFGGRKPLFTQKELLLLTGPLLVKNPYLLKLTAQRILGEEYHDTVSYPYMEQGFATTLRELQKRRDLL